MIEEEALSGMLQDAKGEKRELHRGGVLPRAGKSCLESLVFCVTLNRRGLGLRGSWPGQSYRPVGSA